MRYADAEFKYGEKVGVGWWQLAGVADKKGGGGDCAQGKVTFPIALLEREKGNMVFTSYKEVAEMSSQTRQGFANKTPISIRIVSDLTNAKRPIKTMTKCHCIGRKVGLWSIVEQ